METTNATLPEDLEELKELVLNLQKKNNELSIKVTKLEAENFLFRRELFGRKSERRVTEDPNQVNLFNEIEANAKDEPQDKEEISYTRKKRRKKRLDFSFPSILPRKEVIHKLKPEEMACSCGHCLREFSHWEHEELEIVEPKIYVLVHKHYKYICDNCQKEEKEKEKQDPSYVAKANIVTAKGPERLLPGTRASEGTLAFILTAKFCDGLPFYRLEKILNRYNVKILRSIMCNWAIKVHKALNPFLDLLKKRLLECSVLGVDETPLRVLKVEGQKRIQKCYMWVFYGYGRDGPIPWYHYAPSRGSGVLEDVLEDYHGNIVSDDLEVYTKFTRENELTHGLCNSHARRKFVAAYEEAGKSGESEQYLNWYKELYKIEDNIRKANDFSIDDIVEYRQKHSKPIMEKMKVWLDEREQRVLPESLLGKAIRYSLSNWKKLIVFLDNGIIPIDNNMTENAIRPFVIGRKNFLFSAVDRGAEASAGLYTLIETAKANGLEPYWYLRYLFAQFPNCDSAEDMEKLLPMNLIPEDLKKFEKECSYGS